MKTQKLISIDVENAVKLKEEKNASGLINALLSEYFGMRIKTTKEEIKEMMVENEPAPQ